MSLRGQRRGNPPELPDKVNIKISKMNKIILSFFAFLIIVSCSQNENDRTTKKTIIAGQVSNFEKVSNHEFIKVSFPDVLAENKRITTKIDEKGQFRFEIDLKYPTDFYLEYRYNLSYFITPGDSIHIEISDKCLGKLVKTEAEKYGYYNVSGTSEKMNRDYSKFKIFYYDSLFNINANSDSLKRMEPLDFKKFQLEQLKYFQSSLKSFNKSENTCKEFRNWAKSFIKYENWNNLLQYRWSHAMAINEDVGSYVTKMPVEYFDFLEEMDNIKSEELYFSTYLFFLHQYAMYVDQMVPSDSMKALSGSWNDHFEWGAGFFLRYYQQVEKGFLKDVLISKFYYRMLDAKYYPRLKNIFNAELIEDKELRDQVQQKYAYEKDLVENPGFAEGSKLNILKNEKDFLQALIKNYPDKVIYIDFWAPWCSPCMGEMAFSEKIKKYFEGKDVTFVYLANSCEEPSWKTTIAEKKIEGEHFLLTDNQYSELSDIFGISGIPHYALIDKKGNVVYKKAPRPSSEDALINLINKYLN